MPVVLYLQPQNEPQCISADTQSLSASGTSVVTGTLHPVAPSTVETEPLLAVTTKYTANAAGEIANSHDWMGGGDWDLLGGYHYMCAKVEQYRTQCMAIQASADRVYETNQTLQNMVNTREAEVERSRLYIESNRETAENARRKIAQQDDSIKDLQRKFQDQVHRASVACQERDQLIETNQSQHALIAEHEREMQHKTQMLEQAASYQVDQQRQMDQLHIQMNELSELRRQETEARAAKEAQLVTEVEELRRTDEQHKAHIKRLETEVQAIQATHEAIAAQNDTLTTSIHSKDAETTRLRTSIHSKDAEITRFRCIEQRGQAAAQQKDARLAAAERAQQKRETQLAAARTQLSSMREDAEDLRSNLDQHRQAYMASWTAFSKTEMMQMFDQWERACADYINGINCAYNEASDVKKPGYPSRLQKYCENGRMVWR